MSENPYQTPSGNAGDANAAQASFWLACARTIEAWVFVVVFAWCIPLSQYCAELRQIRDHSGVSATLLGWVDAMITAAALGAMVAAVVYGIRRLNTG